MITRVYRRLRPSKGMALATTAVMLPLIVIVMAFAVDIGLAQVAQSRLETAANQGADAGARRLPDEAGAEQTARAVTTLALSDAASFGRDPVVEVSTTPESLAVEVRMEARAFFGRFVGRQSYGLAASARRQLAP